MAKYSVGDKVKTNERQYVGPTVPIPIGTTGTVVEIMPAGCDSYRVNWGALGVTDPSNPHPGYALDPVASTAGRFQIGGWVKYVGGNNPRSPQSNESGIVTDTDPVQQTVRVDFVNSGVKIIAEQDAIRLPRPKFKTGDAIELIAPGVNSKVGDIGRVVKISGYNISSIPVYLIDIQNQSTTASAAESALKLYQGSAQAIPPPGAMPPLDSFKFNIGDTVYLKKGPRASYPLMIHDRLIDGGSNKVYKVFWKGGKKPDKDAIGVPNLYIEDKLTHIKIEAVAIPMPQKKETNDGRDTCIFCGSPTKPIGCMPGSKMRICTKCKK